MNNKGIRTKNLYQSLSFETSPYEVYEMLMDSQKHSQLTGDEANIDRKIGGKFTAGSGYITGENIELKENEKIVQWWRGNDWPKNHYSKVTFSLTKTKKGTDLELTQIGVPEEHFEDISQGWYDFYWEPLRQMLRSG